MNNQKEKVSEHYSTLEIEPFEIIEKDFTLEEQRGYYKGNILKYTLRDKKQNQEDAVKIQVYAEKLQELELKVNDYKSISLVSRIFTDIEWTDEEPFKITYTNWKEVPVDTPVVYTNGDGMKYARHFCKYDETNDRVVLYAGGRTSFTAKGIIETCPEKVIIYEEEEKRNVIQGEAVHVLMV